MERQQAPLSERSPLLQGGHGSTSQQDGPNTTNNDTSDTVDGSKARFSSWWAGFWVRNKGVVLMFFAMVCSSTMNTTAKLLEQERNGHPGIHPLQTIFARMGITSILSLIYMWVTKVPDAPFGPKGVIKILHIRGMAGFFGLFCLYTSVKYLSIGEATVITFLTPVFTSWAGAVFLKQRIYWIDQVAGFISLFGVVLIARPFGMFGSASILQSITTRLAEVNPTQRILAVGLGLAGTIGTVTAYTAIRKIGDRAHTLISVNYFGMWATLGSLAMLLAVPNISLRPPPDMLGWGLMIYIGLSGFLLQFLLTAGLAYDKTARATNMLYTQILFALIIDRVLWGTVPSWPSLAGGGLIVLCTLFIAMRRHGSDGDKDGKPADAENEQDGSDDVEQRRHND